MIYEVLLCLAVFAPIAAALEHPWSFAALLVLIAAMLQIVRMGTGRLTRVTAFIFFFAGLWLGSGIILWRLGPPRFFFAC